MAAHEGDPAGFERKGRSAEPGMDDLAAQFYRQGSIRPGDTEPTPPAALAEAEEESPNDEVVQPSDEVVEEQAEVSGEETPEESEEAAPEDEEVAAVEGEDAPEMVDMGDGNQIPLDELVKGHLRQADYTRKTQELASQRKALEEEKQQAAAQFAQAGAHLHELTEALQQQIKAAEKEVDMDALRQQDPAEYAARIADLQRKKELAAAASAQQEALYQRQRYEIVMRERAALQDRHDAFKENFDDTYAELTKWVTSPEGGGLPVEMWDQVYDHRAVLLAHKAMQHDRATRNVAPKVARKLAKTPKVVRPGKHVDARQAKSEGYEKAKQTARESGTLDSLAEAFRQRELLKKGR